MDPDLGQQRDRRSIQQWRLDGAPPRKDAPLVLALHGKGMDHQSFARVLQPLQDLPVCVVIPKAPLVTSSGGASWYHYDGNADRFRSELERTEQLLLRFLGGIEASAGLAPRKRVLLGFSQGGYCGAYIALRNPDTFSGMVISGARVKAEILQGAIQIAAGKGFAALLCHGTHDRAVKPEASVSSYEALLARGVQATLRKFETGHRISKAQVKEIRIWLQQHLHLA